MLKAQLLNLVQFIHNVDKEIINFFNGHLSHSMEAFYEFHFLSGDHLFKGGVMMCLYWYTWFSKEIGVPSTKRTYLLSSIFASMLAMGVSRGLTAVLPFHPRPLFDNSLHYFDFPISQYGFDKLSSFPSDHAVMFTALATGLFFVSRKIGFIAMVYNILFILFPRLYLGYHWPSDILAGMAIGASIVLLCMKGPLIRNFIGRLSEPIIEKHPEVFYGLMFLVCYQIADMFDATRQLAGFIKHVARAIF